MKHILIISNIPAPYRVAQFRCLRETFPELRYDQNKAREVFLAWIKSVEEREGGASC